MTEMVQSTREILSSVALFGFDTGDWAHGVATGRRNAALRGNKGNARDAVLNEDQLLQELNTVTQTAELPAAEQPAAKAETVETA